MNSFKKITTASCILVMGLSLGSCELLRFKTAAKLPLEPVKNKQEDEVFHQLQNKPPATESAKPASELFPGTDRFVSGSQQKYRKTVPKGAGSYSLNFDDADLGEVAKVILSDILGQNYVLSPKVAGKVTLQTTEPLTKEELLPTLEMVLRMNNAALVKDGRIYHIEPAAEALYVSNMSNERSGYQTRIIPVRNVAAQDIADIIKPLVHEKTILNVDAARNILVVAGTADEVARVADLVSTFDIDVLRGRSFGLFPLAHVDPETMIEELQSVFYQPVKEGKSGESEFFQFIPIDRLHAVLAITHQAHYLNEIESWVYRLDKANTATGGGVNVYKVQHVDAGELADTLNSIFTGAEKKKKTAKVAPGETASEMSNKEPASSGNMPSSQLGVFAFNPADEKSPADDAAAGGAFAINNSNAKSSAGKAEAGGAKVANVGEVKIIADEPNNSIIIVATAQDYEVILPIINQLDMMPLQVLIDATVVSVTLTNELKYGISWYLSHGGETIASTATPPSTAAQTLGTAATAAAAAATGGLSTFYSSGSVRALLNAQAIANNVNVISSPSLMVLNNQKAKINVGQQIPIQTGTTAVPIAGGATGASIAQSNSIQYKDTGVTLEVTPRVNANGMVIMKLHQIVSKPIQTTTGVTTSATIDKKEINSSVAVTDGETIVLGGLIDETVGNAQNGIPFLYDLPLIGPLFGGTDKTNNKTELVVLITPRVVKGKQDSRVISNEFKRKLTGIYEDVPQGNYETNMGVQQN
ncbi:MAG: type II secretion system secretin GspD [Methylococcales bacterium]|nr:type II secretion system secretin GspD [Methylococcales bacterium]